MESGYTSQTVARAGVLQDIIKRTAAIGATEGVLLLGGPCTGWFSIDYWVEGGDPCFPREMRDRLREAVSNYSSDEDEDGKEPRDTSAALGSEIVGGSA
jgi:hypothetical protein